MRKLESRLSSVRHWSVGSVLVLGFWTGLVAADEVLTLSGDNPNVGFIDNVAPNQNWQILANSDGFKVRDITNAMNVLTPFSIEPGAPTNSLRVNDVGSVFVEGGIANLFVGNNLFVPSGSVTVGSNGGTGRQFGIVDAVDPPAMRFRDTSATPHTWDVEADHLGFDLVSNPNGANTRPFTILPDAPTASLFVATNGSVGIGTNAPNNTGAATGTGKFFNVRADGGTAATGVCNGVFQGTFGAQNHLVHLNAAANQKVMRLQCSSGFFGLHVLTDNLASKAVADCLSIKMSNGNVGLRVLNPAHPLQLASGAHVTAGGVFTNASSRELKRDITPITSEQARDTVRALQPVGYRYNNEPEETYVGFIAEDVPELVATKDRKSLAPMDVVAVLTKVVQDQERERDEDRRWMNRQQKVIDEQQKLLSSLSARLADVEQRLVRQK